MAWPRIKNPRSSAPPGTPSQVTPASATDADQAQGSGQNTGIGGTRHTVAGHADPPGRPARRLGRIRYAHSGEPGAPGEAPLSAAPAQGAQHQGIPAGDTQPLDMPPADYDQPAGLVYEAAGPAPAEPYEQPYPADEEHGPPYSEPYGEGEPYLGTYPEPYPEPYPGTAGDYPEGDYPEGDYPEGDYREYAGHGEGDPADQGLGIFGGGADPAGDLPPPQRAPGDGEQPAAGPGPAGAGPGASWNSPIASPPEAVGTAGDSTEDPFGIRRDWPGGQAAAADEGRPRVAVRDLPPDVQLRFWRLRAIIMTAVGLLFLIVTRNWVLALTLAILAGIIDAIYRARHAARYAGGTNQASARRRTRRQLARMRRAGYFALDARPIPDSREFIDHLVIGPTGVYAIDSEKWDPKLPIRTWNGKKLYHGPESQKARLEHAAWEASQASEILSGALRTEITVRPALAIYGPKIPWDIATIRNVDVFTGSALRKYLKRRNRMRDGTQQLTREQVRTIYDTAARMLPEVAPTQPVTPVG